MYTALDHWVRRNIAFGGLLEPLMKAEEGGGGGGGGGGGRRRKRRR
jgi:hypothetical protein